jgi:hypothetical protein
MKKLRAILLANMLMLLLIPMYLVKADSWVEVIRFEGTSGVSEEHFTCDYGEWRIRWEFDPGHYHFFPEYHSLTVTTYREGEDKHLVDSIYEMANESRSGTSYVQDSYGQYYMAIRASDIESYTIIVEQNIDYVSEPTPTPTSTSNPTATPTSTPPQTPPSSPILIVAASAATIILISTALLLYLKKRKS